jgi:hypothetical protein
MAVEKRKTVPTPPSQSQPSTDENTAVAAEYDDKCVGNEGPDAIRQLHRVGSDTFGVAISSTWRPSGLIARRHQHTSLDEFDALSEARLSKRPAQLVTARNASIHRRSQSEIGRRIENHKWLHRQLDRTARLGSPPWSGGPPPLSR